MIQSTKPKYRIKYRQCNHNKNHQGEKLNFVCLEPKCCQKSLICSMCREDAHRDHSIQPLKFYIQSLKKQYQTDQSDYSKQFELLEQSRSIFLTKLRESVEKIAEQFQKLQQQVIDRFEQLRNQIIQNQSKKNKFSQFYNSLTTQTEDNPQFLIQNYLPSKRIANMDNFESVEQLGKKLSATIYEAREGILSIQNKQEPVIVSKAKFQEKLASTVTHVGNNYLQTNSVINATAQTVSAITVDLIKNFQTNRFKLKILKLKKGSTIFFGAMQKQYFKSLNHKAPPIWNCANTVGKIYYFNSQAQTYGHATSQLKTFSQNSNIQVTMDSNVMKIAMKKNSATFNLPPNGEFYFFFCLMGQAEIELVVGKK